VAYSALGARKDSVRRAGDLSVLAAPVILASASPRRTQLLTQLGIAHKVQPANIDETPEPREAALAYVQRMAATKALAGSERALDQAKLRQPSPAVLAADTIVVVDGAILGKPLDEQDGQAMLGRLSGRTHQVVTAVCLRHGVRQAAAMVSTSVTFRSVSLQEARGYWATGEPQDKAGGYGIQGAAAEYVSKIAGSYTGVIGLPLVETRALFYSLGLLSV